MVEIDRSRFIASLDTIVNMLKNESDLKKEIIIEIEKEIKKEIELKKERKEKKFKLDKHFVTLDKEKELVSVHIYRGTNKGGKLVDSFKVIPDKVIDSILYNISDGHKKYLEKEIKKIKSGEKYVQE